MNTIVVDTGIVRIPPSMSDLATFRRWVHSDEVPDGARTCFLDGEVWVDMSKEQFFSHNQVKNEYGFVLTGLAKEGRRGRYIPDGMLLTHVAANLSSQPDGVFVSKERLEYDRVRLVKGAKEGFVELEGSPDMVLEVVSDSSVEKDTILLPDPYWQAEIDEYWLVDARGENLMFQILRREVGGYVDQTEQASWVKSEVFGRLFRFTRRFDALGHPEYALEHREP